MARLDVPVLLAGESGSGKELVARAIHEASARRAHPYVAVNLGAIPPTLAAAELFGASRGAFTGAERARAGYFERARGGTLFLDEIGDAPGEIQSLLLRVLDSGEIQTVGGTLPLGAGGMGEAYAAYDERLERRVAVKLIRPESAESPAARERFRREARAAAALNHPAIVQVYDVLNTEQGDAIVMEHVEGCTLAGLLCSGTPAAEAALALAAQVAEGLAAAHAHGIVHRDLKAENVMVTPSGQAKILDFGLARHEPGASASSATTAGVAGTYKAMSPEQARALPVDHLSDLFSFGTLLYELFSGRSPFAAASPLETLTNVCTHTPPLLRETNPEVPEALSALVERLLQKEPGRRPQDTLAVADELRAMLASTAGENAAARRLSAWSRTAAQPHDTASGTAAATGPLVHREAPAAPAASSRGRRRRGLAAAALLAGVGAGAAWLAMRPRAAPPLSVAVPRVVLDGASSEAAETMQAGARAALLRGLLSLAGVVPVAPNLVDPVPGTALDAARAVAADELISAHVACQSETCRVTLARLDGQDGRLLWTADFEAPALQPALLPAVVLGHLRQAYPGRGLRAGMRPLEVSQADFAEYLALRRGFDSQGQEGAPLATLDARLAALRQRAPSFVEAGVFEADVLRRRFVDTRDRAQLDRAAAVLQSLRDLAPADPRPLAVLFEVALSRADLDGAEKALDELERLQPGDPAVSMQRARLLQRRRADPARTLELARSAVRRRPSYLNLLRAAQIENGVGGPAGTQAARAYLEELLKRYPSYTVGRSNLAEIELLKGSPQRAAELYGELARGSPTLAVLVNLGVANLLLARYAEAEQALRRATSLAPANPIVALNLADVVLLQKRDDDARAIYRRVVSLADADPAASQWQIRSVRAQALAHLGARREAAEALQRMLAVAGDDPQAAAEAAVTYAVLGDQAVPGRRRPSWSQA